MIYSAKKNYLIPLSVIVFILVILILNFLIKPDLTIKTYFQAYPKEKWALVKGNNGQLVSSMFDYETGHAVQYNLNQFERGEFISLKFSDKLKNKKEINEGDTVAAIQSSDVEDQLISAEGELDVAKADLNTKSAGEKKSLIKEAENKLKYTEEKIKEQKVLFQRINSLYEKGLNSQEEYETQKWVLDLLEIEKQIYKSQLENVSSGLKDEDIGLVETRIVSLKSRLAFLENRKNKLIVISPISGYTSNLFSSDTLLAVINDKEIILNMPIKIEDLPLVKKGDQINIRIDNPEKEYTGLVVSLSREVKFLNNQQVVFISIKIDNSDGELLTGMVKESYLKIKQITFYEFIQRFFST